MTRRVFTCYVLPLAVTLGVAIAAFAFVQADTSLSAPSDAAPLPLWAMSIAKQVAAANGDASPETVQFSLTTPAQAAAVIDERSGDTTSQVYAVVMRGDFTMYGEHLPRGTDPPHADWIMLVLDPKDQSVGGMAAAAGTPDTTALGRTTAAELVGE